MTKSLTYRDNRQDRKLTKTKVSELYLIWKLCNDSALVDKESGQSRLVAMIDDAEADHGSEPPCAILEGKGGVLDRRR